MLHTRTALAGFLLLASVSFASARAEDPTEPPPERWQEDHRGVYSLSFENDIFAGGDNNYTNGVRFAYVSPEGDVPHWLDKTASSVPFFSENGHKRWGLALGQSIFTPDNIRLTTPQPNDQPYAGWLYGSASVISDTGNNLDAFQLTLGMVGPSSLAEQSQKFIHSTIGSDYPQGWRYQLKNEPGVVLSYERKWRNLFQSEPFGWSFDITPSAGVNLGNIYTDATVGAIARFGKDLPDDYGPPLISPSLTGSDFFIPTSDFGWYVFGGLQGQAVARDIFLDGNTWKDSASVDKNPLIGAAQAGIAFTFDDMRLSYTHVFRTEQFKGQKHADSYGSLNLSMRF